MESSYNIPALIISGAYATIVVAGIVYPYIKPYFSRRGKVKFDPSIKFYSDLEKMSKDEKILGSITTKNVHQMIASK